MFKIVNKLKNNKAFTLIELIVVLAVLAIIMAIAVPRFLGVQADAKLKADENTIELIKKAAELYAVADVNKTDFTTTPTVQDLIDAGYLDSIKWQSTSHASGVSISINTSTGEVDVTPK